MGDEMSVTAPRRRRVKIGATVDPDLVAAVDAYVAEHPGADRSGVIDDALRLWYAKRQEEAMEAQYTAPQSATERAERAAWRKIRRAAAIRSLQKR